MARRGSGKALRLAVSLRCTLDGLKFLSTHSDFFGARNCSIRTRQAKPFMFVQLVNVITQIEFVFLLLTARIVQCGLDDTDEVVCRVRFRTKLRVRQAGREAFAKGFGIAKRTLLKHLAEWPPGKWVEPEVAAGGAGNGLECRPVWSTADQQATSTGMRVREGSKRFG